MAMLTFRTLVAATILLGACQPNSGQVSGQAPGPIPSALHIKVVLVDASQKPTPVPRHALLISDNPATAPPRRIVTGPDGTADVKLRPGNYTVESDRPVVFNGRSYQWTQIVDIVAGRDTSLELTAGNANVEPVTGGMTTSASDAVAENDPAFLLSRWQDGIVAVWTSTTRATGFVVDPAGLVATNQRVIGDETSVEVQFTPALKVAARVLAADRARDVAVLWVNPTVLGPVRPVPLECATAVQLSVADGEDIFTIGAPLRGQKVMTPGTVSEVEPQAILSDFRLAPGSLGGPVFTAAGRVIGITSVADETGERRGGEGRVVRAGDACDVLASAKKKAQDAAPPGGTHLPVEPERPYAVDTLEAAARDRAGNLNPYQLSSSDFDVFFITPVMIYAASSQPGGADGRERGRDTGAPGIEQARPRPLSDFSNWSEYVADVPPVLLVRVTPKLVEGFWTKVGRGAASTQGISIPPIKRFRPGFARMRTFCATTEVTPIHPFTLEQRVSEDSAIHEGLYVFDPGALGPHCGTVKLVLYSDKDGEKGDTRSVEPSVLKKISDDFAALGRQ